jgi:hypothetical protein
MNNLTKLPLGVDFTAGGLNQLQITHSAFAPNSLRIYSTNFLHVCMNVITGVPEKEFESITPLFIGGLFIHQIKWP